jgi:SAM-dependent methyltransferase
MISKTRLLGRLLRLGFDPCQASTWLELRRALAGCNSILDVGCGDASNLCLLQCPHLTGIEAYEPSYESAKRKGTHHALVLGDIRKLDQIFRPRQFDACVALDVIEHLHKEEGLKFLQDMERIAAKTVVVTTPSGFLPQRHAQCDDLQEHLSGWDAPEMRALGYRVIGLLGPRKLRGEYHALRFRPKAFWGLIAWLGHLFWTRTWPESAAALLAAKSVTQ